MKNVSILIWMENQFEFINVVWNEHISIETSWICLRYKSIANT